MPHSRDFSLHSSLVRRTIRRTNGIVMNIGEDIERRVASEREALTYPKWKENYKEREEVNVSHDLAQ